MSQNVCNVQQLKVRVEIEFYCNNISLQFPHLFIELISCRNEYFPSIFLTTVFQLSLMPKKRERVMKYHNNFQSAVSFSSCTPHKMSLISEISGLVQNYTKNTVFKFFFFYSYSESWLLSLVLFRHNSVDLVCTVFLVRMIKKS